MVLDCPLLLKPITKQTAGPEWTLLLTKRIKIAQQVLKRASHIRRKIQQMSDSGTPVSGGGAPRETRILDNQSPFARVPAAGFLRRGGFAFPRVAQFPQRL